MEGCDLPIPIALLVQPLIAQFLHKDTIQM